MARLPSEPRCVITGAASGLGRALAVELSRRHAHLVLADVDASGMRETERLAEGAGAGTVRAIPCDVTSLAQVEALASDSGDVDLLVNNAGVASAGRVGELSIEDWRWTLEIDLMGVVHGCHAFVPRMRSRGRGHILNIASAAGLLCLPGMAAYNVAKAAVLALSETLAMELAGTGIGVTAVCPTFFRSQIAKSGRFEDARTRGIAERLVARAGPPEFVARDALTAVERGLFLAVPMAAGRWAWRFKCASPRLFRAIAGRALRRSFAKHPVV